MSLTPKWRPIRAPVEGRWTALAALAPATVYLSTGSRVARFDGSHWADLGDAGGCTWLLAFSADELHCVWLQEISIAARRWDGRQWGPEYPIGEIPNGARGADSSVVALDRLSARQAVLVSHHYGFATSRLALADHVLGFSTEAAPAGLEAVDVAGRLPSGARQVGRASFESDGTSAYLVDADTGMPTELDGRVPEGDWPGRYAGPSEPIAGRERA